MKINSFINSFRKSSYNNNNIETTIKISKNNSKEKNNKKSLFKLSNKKKDLNFELLLKNKIIKLKEKKFNSTKKNDSTNLTNNNNNLTINNFLIFNNSNIFNNNNNFFPNTTRISKIKNKIILNNTTINSNNNNNLIFNNNFNNNLNFNKTKEKFFHPFKNNKNSVDFKYFLPTQFNIFNKKNYSVNNSKINSFEYKKLNTDAPFNLKNKTNSNFENFVIKKKEKKLKIFKFNVSKDNINNNEENINNINNNFEIKNKNKEKKLIKKDYIEVIQKIQNNNNNNNNLQLINKEIINNNLNNNLNNNNNNNNKINDINNNNNINNNNKNNIINNNKNNINNNNNKNNININNDINLNITNIDSNQKIDTDLPNSENDSLLSTFNLKIKPSKNLNESSLSITSNISKQTRTDQENLISYIKKFKQKHKKYPKTKLNFYKYGRLLGKGAFGKVNLSLHVLTGKLVAIKSINKQNLKKKSKREKILLETNIMKKINKCPFIVKIYETYETTQHFCIVMEYICAGDLLNFIKKRTKLPEQTAKFIFKQIIIAIKYIHSKNIIHRDIKLDNILIDLDNKIKICDFGVSKFLTSKKLFDQCGTPAYIAPEILRREGYDFSVDVWSAGVVLYAMLSGNVPFKGKNQQSLHEAILKGKFKEIENVSFECRDLIRKIFEVDVEKRIKIDEILEHSWLNDFNGNFNDFNRNFSDFCLFTKAERILFDVDKIEIFDVKNLNSECEIYMKNNRTKSVILAPFNSSFEDENFNRNSNEINKNSAEFYDFNNKNLKLENNILKFAAKVKEINYNYELNNNCEIDNGIIISQNETKTKIFSPLIIENSNKNSAKNVFNNNNKIVASENEEIKEEINLNAIKEMEKFGFNKEFVKNCIKNNENNYATTGYYLLVKYSNQNLN